MSLQKKLIITNSEQLLLVKREIDLKFHNFCVGRIRFVETI
jgi:hypothetical protein